MGGQFKRSEVLDFKISCDLNVFQTCFTLDQLNAAETTVKGTVKPRYNAVHLRGFTVSRIFLMQYFYAFF